MENSFNILEEKCGMGEKTYVRHARRDIITYRLFPEDVLNNDDAERLKVL